MARNIRKKSMKLLFPAPLPPMRTFKFVSSKFSKARIDLNPFIVNLSSACVMFMYPIFNWHKADRRFYLSVLSLVGNFALLLQFYFSCQLCRSDASC